MKRNTLSSIKLPSTCGEGTVLYRGYAAFYQYDEGRWKSERQNDTRIYIIKVGDSNPRIVGVSCKDGSVVLNTWVYRTIDLWHSHSSHFVQWHDKKNVYGLSFEDEGLCGVFVSSVQQCVTIIREAQAKQAAGSVQASSAATRNQIEKAKGGKGGGGGGRLGMKFPIGGGGHGARMTQQDASEMMEEYKIEGIKLKKPECMRDHKAFEIYVSEVAYCDTLSRIVYMCKIPVEQTGLLTMEQLDQMFSNVQDIYEYNCKFLKKLEAAYASWEMDTTKIGHLFVELLPTIDVYAPYFKNYEEIPKLLDQLAKSKKTAAWLDGPQVQEATKGHGLTHLLIQPCQRLMRYVMLVNELVKETTEEHPDFQGLQDALAGLQKAAAAMNESVRESENQKFLAHITLNPNTYIGFDVIIEPSRVLLTNMACTVAITPTGVAYGHVYVFNDSVVFCELIEEKKQTKQRVAETLHLDQIWVELGGDKPFSVKLTTPENQYIVQLANANDQTTFKGAMDQAVEKVITKITNETGHRSIEVNFANGDRYVGEVLNAVLEGRGTFHVACGNKYTGQMENGKFTGEGEMVYSLGGESICRYNGTWKEDLYDGEGTLEFEGNKYVGAWVQGRKEGNGTMTWANGATYRGEWLRDLQNGKGIFFSSATSESYEGDWKEGNFHGQGVLQWPMGRYEGDFVNDLKEGKGKMRSVTIHGLELYDGDWKNDVRHGQGVVLKQAKRMKPGGKEEEEYTVLKYEGEWVEGTMSKKGELVTGMLKYVGEMKDGRMEGEKCVVEFKDGSKYEGTMKDDKKQGQGKFEYSNGDVYTGAFHNNQKYGRGQLISKEWEYQGDWLSDEMSKGTLVFPTGAKYSGNYSQSKPHGKGVFEFQTVKYVGEWKDGLCSGQGSLTVGDDATLESGWEKGVAHGEGTYKNHKGAYKFEGGFEEGQRSGAGKVTFEKSKEEVEVFFQQGSLSRPSVDSFPPPPPTPLFIVK